MRMSLIPTILVTALTVAAPWGNLAIFYKPFRGSPGLVPLGRFDAPVAGRLKDGPVRIKLAD